MQRSASVPTSINAESSSSSVGSSNGTRNSLAGRPPFLFTSGSGTSGRRFHAASRTANPQAGPPAVASQSLSSTLGLFPRAGASPLHNVPSMSQYPATSASLVAPQPDRAAEAGVKIKTRDSTSINRRAAVKQSCYHDPGPRLKTGAVSQQRPLDTPEAAPQQLRASTKHPDFHLSSAEAADGYSHLFNHGATEGQTAVIQPRTTKLVASQMMQQHLSPISEVANASFSSGSLSRDVIYEGCSDDGSDVPNSAVRTMSPLESEQALARSRHDHSLASSASNLPLQVPSPVQRQASPVFDAFNGDTLIQNMDDLIADPAPMQVSNSFAFVCDNIHFIILYSASFPMRCIVAHIRSAEMVSRLRRFCVRVRLSKSNRIFSEQLP